jgi:hypothetical protein
LLAGNKHFSGDFDCDRLLLRFDSFSCELNDNKLLKCVNGDLFRLCFDDDDDSGLSFTIVARTLVVCDADVGVGDWDGCVGPCVDEQVASCSFSFGNLFWSLMASCSFGVSSKPLNFLRFVSTTRLRGLNATDSAIERLDGTAE